MILKCNYHKLRGTEFLINGQMTLVADLTTLFVMSCAENKNFPYIGPEIPQLMEQSGTSE